MKILATLDNFGLVGGSERYAGQAIAALAARGHEVQVLCGAKRAPALVLPRSVSVHVDENYSDAGATPRELRALAQQAASFQPDVVFVLSCFQASTFEALLDVAPLLRFVQDHTLFCPSLNKILADGSNCHRPLGAACLERYFTADGCSCYRQPGRVKPWIEGVGEFKKKYLEFESAKRAKRLMVASRYMKSELVQCGAASDHVVVNPYFTRSNTKEIPRAALAKETERFLADASLPLVLTPGRLCLPDKGLDVLLRALARVDAPMRAVIAGDGPARTWLEAKAQADGLSNRVHFTGWQSAGQIETLLARARVVVFPSTWKEPFGLVGLEAMAHAKPTVAFDVGGVSEWLRQEHTGYLLARGDVPGMASTIEHLCSDASLASVLGASGRQVAEREFSEAAHMARLESELAHAAGLEASHARAVAQNS